MTEKTLSHALALQTERKLSWEMKGLQCIVLHCIAFCITLHCIFVDCILHIFHCTALHFALHCIVFLHCIAFCITLHCIFVLHFAYFALHCIAFCITLHCIFALHCILHYTELHFAYFHVSYCTYTLRFFPRSWITYWSSWYQTQT